MRNKLAEMTPIEALRYSALAARRAAQRALFEVNSIKNTDSLSPEAAKAMQSTVAWAQTVLATTRPAWVKKAARDELLQLFSHLVGRKG
jgi:propanediol dehydratase small subunit